MIVNNSRHPTKKTLVMMGLVTVSILQLPFLLQQLRLQLPREHTKATFNVLQWTQGSAEPDNRRIFFHETSGRQHLNVRQSCAVESAARNNPNRSIQLFLSVNSLTDNSSPFISVLKQYSNVAVSPLNESQYFANTPLEKWYLDGEWRTSSFRIEHMSDYIRMLTLYKGGGFYMDLDYITMKTLDEKKLWNFFSYEGPKSTLVTNSAFHLERGHRLIKKIIAFMGTNYSPDHYFWNGPLMLTKIMKENCGIREGVPNSNKCNDVEMISHSHLCPIPNAIGSWEKLFRTPTTETLSLINESYSVHAWNVLSFKEPLRFNSSQLYASLASKHCPLTVAKATSTSWH